MSVSMYLSVYVRMRVSIYPVGFEPFPRRVQHCEESLLRSRVSVDLFSWSPLACAKRCAGLLCVARQQLLTFRCAWWSLCSLAKSPDQDGEDGVSRVPQAQGGGALERQRCAATHASGSPTVERFSCEAAVVTRSRSLCALNPSNTLIR